MQNVTESAPQAEATQSELKQVSLSPLENEQHKKDLSSSIKKMNAIKEEVNKIHDTISAEYNALDARLNALVEKKVITKSGEHSETDKSIKDYLQLLTLIAQEVSGEVATLESILNNDGSQTITVAKNDPESMDDLVAVKLKSARAQAKEIESSLKVSFSRYQHWLTRSRLSLDNIELSVR